MVTTDSRTQGHAVYKTVGDNLPELPIVVLIDRNTASAAEILTAALADDAGATVVGTRSFGKGVFQQEIDLSNGGALKLTVGEYFTPDGVNLAGKGIHPTCGRRDLPATGARRGPRARPRGARRAVKVRRAMSWREWRRRPGTPRARGAAGGPSRRTPATRSRRCCASELGGRGFRAALEVEAGRAARCRRARIAARAATSPSCRPSPSTRRPRATSTTPSRPGARATACGSGSTSPTSPPTCTPGSPLDLEARRRANSTYVPGAVEPMLPRALSEEACSLAPGVERLAVTAEIELGAGGAPARGELLPQPHPLRRAPRLRPARPRLRRPRRARPRRSPSRWRSRARRPRRWASGAARPASTSSPSSPSSASTPAATSVGARARRADRVAPADRAADDPRQRTGRPAARAQAGAGRSTASTPSPTRGGSSGWSRSCTTLGVPTPPLRPGRWRRARRARSRPRRAGW